MRIPVPQLPEPIVAEGRQVGEIYECYAYDPEKKRWLVTGEDMDKLLEVSQSEAIYDGRVMWTFETSFWESPPPLPMEQLLALGEEKIQEREEDSLENAVIRWLEGA